MFFHSSLTECWITFALSNSNWRFYCSFKIKCTFFLTFTVETRHYRKVNLLPCEFVKFPGDFQCAESHSVTFLPRVCYWFAGFFALRQEELKAASFQFWHRCRLTPPLFSRRSCSSCCNDSSDTHWATSFHRTAQLCSSRPLNLPHSPHRCFLCVCVCVCGHEAERWVAPWDF